MGTFFRFFFAAPVAFIVTVLIFLGLYNQLSSNPFLYKEKDGPDVVYFGIADLFEPIAICYCGWFSAPEIEVENQWTESEKAAQEPPKQTPRKPSVTIDIQSPFQDDVAPCSGDENQPILRIAPSYPQACIDKRAEGAVVLQFNITPEGNVTNIVILESADECFNQGVISMVEKWRYPPLCHSDGTPAGKTGVVQRISFQLAD